MVAMPKQGEKVRSKFNGREFIVELVGERMIVLQERREAIRFVTTIDNLRSFYELDKDRSAP
ncbi:MAG TPA: hypothetical protein PKN85_05880 [Syntrophorhabdaceae bacterium]|nr:hypothetical protein [Syntrophorhabdaceae bacterium]HOD75973.1 hypothetical protein [Syntrophorhabdaceae bacterium]